MQILRKPRADCGQPGRFDFRELIERPMGTINACGMMVTDNSHVTGVSGLLSDQSARVRSRAAWTLGNAAAKGVDISPAVESLEACLHDPERDVAIAGGYALTMHWLGKSPGAEPPLAKHLRDAVRIGANLALSDSKKGL